MTKDNRGGKRPGAGRKPGPKTVTLSYRVLESISKELDTKIRALIASYDQNRL